jgi:hypothetical protein
MRRRHHESCSKQAACHPCVSRRFLGKPGHQAAWCAQWIVQRFETSWTFLVIEGVLADKLRLKHALASWPGAAVFQRCSRLWSEHIHRVCCLLRRDGHLSRSVRRTSARRTISEQTSLAELLLTLGCQWFDARTRARAQRTLPAATYHASSSTHAAPIGNGLTSNSRQNARGTPRRSRPSSSAQTGPSPSRCSPPRAARAAGAAPPAAGA